MLGSPAEVLEDSSSNGESEMGDTEPGGCGSQPGSSRGVVRPLLKQPSHHKKKRKVDDTDTELSEKLVKANKTSTREGISLNQSRGVVRHSDEQLSNVLKKKKKVDGTDPELSEKTSSREGISMHESPITKPSTPSTSLTSCGQWVANVTAGLHPSLERAWTKQVIKMTLLGQYRRCFCLYL